MQCDVPVSVVGKLLNERQNATKIGSNYLVIEIILVLRLTPTPIINTHHVIGPIILPLRLTALPCNTGVIESGVINCCWNKDELRPAAGWPAIPLKYNYRLG